MSFDKNKYLQFPTPLFFSGGNFSYIYYLYATRKVKSVKFNNHSDTSLFTFFLQLVQYLKMIGTVPAIDINDYLETVGESIDMDI